MDVAISGPLESWFTGNKCGQEVLQPQLTRMALSAETPRVPGQDGDLAACSWCCCPPHPPRTPLHGQAGHQLGSPRAFGVELRIGVIWFKSLALSPASWGWPQLVPLGVWGEQEFPPPCPELVGQRFASDCEGLADGDGEEQALKISP